MPFRIEFGEKELKDKKVLLFTRDTGKKELIAEPKISDISKLGEQYDLRLKTKADDFMKDKTVDCKTKEELKKAMRNHKIARANFCSVGKEGIKCAEVIEQEIGADVRGTMANKSEKPSSGEKCIICGKPAKEVVYIGKSY